MQEFYYVEGCKPYFNKLSSLLSNAKSFVRFLEYRDRVYSGRMTEKDMSRFQLVNENSRYKLEQERIEKRRYLIKLYTEYVNICHSFDFDAPSQAISDFFALLTGKDDAGYRFRESSLKWCIESQLIIKSGRPYDGEIGLTEITQILAHPGDFPITGKRVDFSRAVAEHCGWKLAYPRSIEEMLDCYRSKRG